MSNYLRPLLPISIYQDHDLNSPVIGTLEPNTFVKFNREKRRNGTNWIEIYTADGSTAYIQKSGSYTILTKVSVKNDTIQGFNYKWINPEHQDQPLPFEQVFDRKIEPKEGFKRAKLSAYSDSEDDLEFIFDYDPDLIEVETFKLNYDDEVYQFKAFYDKKEALIEIGKPNGFYGMILNGSKLKAEGELVFEVIFWIVIAATVLAIFIGFLQAGYIVVSGLMILAGLAVAFVVMIVAMIVKEILKGIFKQIAKRF